MTMTFQTALAALARIEAWTPQPLDAAARGRGAGGDFVERIEGLAIAAKAFHSPATVIGRGLRDVLGETK